VPAGMASLCRLATAQHGVVSRSQAHGFGLSTKMIHRLAAQGFLNPVLPDVFAVGGPPATWRRQLMSGVLQLGTSGVVSVRAAAALHRFDTFRPGPLEFTVDPFTRTRLPFGTVHETALHDEELDRCDVDGIRCTSPLRTVFDLAAHIGRRRLEHVVDGGLRDGHFTEGDLLDVLARLRRSGRTGVARFEEALVVSAGPVATSVLERRFLRLVADAGLPVPVAQVVHRDGDRFVARVDFQFAGTPVIVEVEGHRYHSTRRQRQRDAERRNDLENLGNHVLVFTYEDVRERPSYVRAQVRRALAPFLH
jgi:hypothetical protein